MGKYPVLKPREVTAILEKLALLKLDSAARTNSIATRTGVAQRFPSTADVTSHQSCCGKSLKT
jgi:hypothetical protein